jgi:DNA polymerase V
MQFPQSLKSSSNNEPLIFLENTVAAGFPNPCDDFISRPISLDELLIKRASSSFLVKVAGSSMMPTIQTGSILVVDKSIVAKHDSIVVAIISNEFIVKQLKLPVGSLPILHSHNKEYCDVIIDEGSQDSAEIWGCVTACITQF